MHLKTVSLLLKNWSPVLLVMAIIFSFSHFQAASSDAQSGFFLNLLRIFSPNLAETKIAIILIRKFAHFFEYAVFGFLTARAFRLSNLPISCALFFLRHLCRYRRISPNLHRWAQWGNPRRPIRYHRRPLWYHYLHNFSP